METAQALAIAAAAFVTSLVIDAPAFSQHISARTEAAIEAAVENAVWRAEVRPSIVLHDAAFAPPSTAHWDACETAPKAVRL